MIVNWLAFVVIVQTDSVMPAIHSLEKFITASTGIANLPDHVCVVYVDHIAVMYYDSKSRILQTRNNWIREATADDADFWERERTIAMIVERSGRSLLETVRKTLNQSEGVHFGQARFGCEWDDQTDALDAWEKIKYEDEHVLLFDVNTFTWTIEGPQGLAIRHKFVLNEIERDIRQYFYMEDCPSLLKKLVNDGRSVLMRTELPKVSLLQKMPSSPVTCHATGFYPDVADLFWRKDGEQLHEDVDYGQTLPNHDGTFQMMANLKVEVTAEVEGRYECVFQLAGVQDEIVIKLERGNILSNARIEEEEKKRRTVAIAASLVALALVLVLVAIVVVIKCHPRKPDDDAPASAGTRHSGWRNTMTFHGHDQEYIPMSSYPC
ncbi:major histocompatibility complex class I-related gene protein-like isoform X1 [Hippocampus comes]|uniref:Major histocompatibility complex class I-related gene protein-like n=1 Tax=Hippocampus comes TaxID=109280 RepID=A0A3Q3E3A4_HIPCM|nr:PREDICTED: major histocompatibility complex class I-related gene protein-like isoform X1 [Hippocampus comes]